MPKEPGEPKNLDENEQLTDEELQSHRENMHRNIIEGRDYSRQNASELQKEVSEAQSARYETSLLKLMERTNTNPDLVNAMKKFLDGLEQYVDFAVGGQFGSERQEELEKFMQEVGKALMYDSVSTKGRTKGFEKVDFSRWEHK